MGAKPSKKHCDWAISNFPTYTFEDLLIFRKNAKEDLNLKLVDDCINNYRKGKSSLSILAGLLNLGKENFGVTEYNDYEIPSGEMKFIIPRNGDTVTNIEILDYDSSLDIFYELNIGDCEDNFKYKTKSNNFQNVINHDNQFSQISLQFRTIYIKLQEPIKKNIKIRIWYNYFSNEIRRILAQHHVKWQEFIFGGGICSKYSVLKEIWEFSDSEMKEYVIQTRNHWKYRFDENIPKIPEYITKKKFNNCLEELLFLYPFESENFKFEGGQGYLKTKESFESRKNKNS